MKKSMIILSILLATQLLSGCNSSAETFKAGTWTSETDEGLCGTYYFYTDQNGIPSFEVTYSSVDVPNVSTYELKGESAIFHLGGQKDSTDVSVEKTDENHMTLTYHFAYKEQVVVYTEYLEYETEAKPEVYVIPYTITDDSGNVIQQADASNILGQYLYTDITKAKGLVPEASTLLYADGSINVYEDAARFYIIDSTNDIYTIVGKSIAE